MQVLNMISLWVFSVVYSIYGCLGLLGYQVIPQKYKGTECEKEYKRFRGISWLLIGVPWFLVHLILLNREFSIIGMAVLMIGTSIPGIVFSVIGERKYRNLLNK